jgi:hypothetical protein
MKIHYLATSNVPSRTANALQIVKMCESISKLGHSISLLTPNLKTQNMSLKKYYDLKHNFELIKIGKLKENIIGLNNILIPLDLVLKSLILGCDLIITRNSFISLILIILRKKHILELHDDLNVSGNLISKIFKLFNLLNSSSINKVIFISLNLKKFITTKYNYKNKNFEILHDATEIKNDDIKVFNGEKLNIGYFGSIYKSRGINLILDLARLDKKNNYYIYGGTKNDMEKLINRNRLKNLVLKSQIPYAMVKKEIIKMDVLLMPYTKKTTISGDHGNIIKFMSPMKMFDYLGAAKIILSADIPVLREILIPNYNSILIKNFMNVKNWKLNIDKIINNKNKFLIMRKNALKTAKQNNWNLRAKNMLSN